MSQATVEPPENEPLPANVRHRERLTRAAVVCLGTGANGAAGQSL